MLESAAHHSALTYWTECLVSSAVQVVTQQRVTLLTLAVKLIQPVAAKSLLAAVKLLVLPKIQLAAVKLLVLPKIQLAAAKNQFAGVNQRLRVVKQDVIRLQRRAVADYCPSCSQRSTVATAVVMIQQTKILLAVVSLRLKDVKTLAMQLQVQSAAVFSLSFSRPAATKAVMLAMPAKRLVSPLVDVKSQLADANQQHLLLL